MIILSTGNVTPIPTQGELEEISIEEPDLDLDLDLNLVLVPDPLILISEGNTSARQTPLKSLLKRQNLEIEELAEPQCVSDSEVDGRESPKKSVHFSEIDQVAKSFTIRLLTFLSVFLTQHRILQVT